MTACWYDAPTPYAPVTVALWLPVFTVNPVTVTSTGDHVPALGGAAPRGVAPRGGGGRPPPRHDGPYPRDDHRGAEVRSHVPHRHQLEIVTLMGMVNVAFWQPWSGLAPMAAAPA